MQDEINACISISGKRNANLITFHLQKVQHITLTMLIMQTYTYNLHKQRRPELMPLQAFALYFTRWSSRKSTLFFLWLLFALSFENMQFLSRKWYKRKAFRGESPLHVKMLHHASLLKIFQVRKIQKVGTKVKERKEN